MCWKDYKISPFRISLVKRLLAFVEFSLNMAKNHEGTFNIRTAVEADKNDIYRVHTTAIRKTCSSHYGPEEVDVWVRRQNPDRYVEFLSRGEIVIAEAQDERVLGFGHSIPDTILNQGVDEQGKSCVMQVKGLFVDPEHHRKGVGGALMKYLENTASEQGAKALTVHATLNAVEFYKKCGFYPSEAVEHQLSDEVRLQCWKMIKNLDD